MTVLSRLALPLFAGSALAVLAACAPAPEAAAPSSEVASIEEAAELEAEIASADTGEAHEHGEDHDHDHDDHDHDHDHAHDHSHDHGHGHDHAGGSAHVHGVADLAFALEGTQLTAEMISPLANFGLSEAEGIITEAVTASLPGLIVISGGDCTASAPRAAIDRTSGHTDAKVEYRWTCTSPTDLASARFAGFGTYPGFETVNAVFIGPGAQKAAALTPSSPQLSLR
ncbi:DUF2796 domain-containing protein [Hyphomonas sp.]|uniref:ZrgA family zinc uptake protein n=1 Tax=Hyphomonas sp. TaxID=87 RepID=UPI00391BA7EE